MRVVPLLLCFACAFVGSLRFEPLGAVGFEVVGLDVRGALENRELLQSALEASRGLLVMRGLHNLTVAELADLGSIFGNVEAEPVDGDYERLVEGDARVHEFSRVPSSQVYGDDDDDDDETRFDVASGRPSWHTDQSFRAPRPKASAMYCLRTPKGVGDTLFASGVAALGSLPRELAIALESVKGLHSRAELGRNFQRLVKKQALLTERDASSSVAHSLSDGRALYLAPHAIVSLLDSETGRELECRSLVDSLARQMTRPEFVVRHCWRPGDLVVWDNTLTMHAATQTPARRAHERLMWRMTLGSMEEAMLPSKEVRCCVSRAILLGVVRDALVASGSGPSQALEAAEALVSAEAEGACGHGLRRLEEVCDALRRGDVATHPKVDVTQSGPIVRVDGGGGLAWSSQAALLLPLAESARRYGVALGVITQTRSVSGRLAPFVETLARDFGLVVLAAANTPAYLAFLLSGGKPDKVLGTNPVAFAFPRHQQGNDPLVVDMALSAQSRASIEVAAKLGASIPLGVAVDALGKPTTDPAAALGGAQLPVGGHKGALLALLVDLLAGALTSSDLGVDSDDYHTMNRGQIFLAVDPNNKLLLSNGNNNVELLLSRLFPTMIPGARAQRNRAKNAQELEIKAADFFKIRHLATELPLTPEKDLIQAAEDLCNERSRTGSSGT